MRIHTSLDKYVSSCRIGDDNEATCWCFVGSIANSFLSKVREMVIDFYYEYLAPIDAVCARSSTESSFRLRELVIMVHDYCLTLSETI